MILKCPDSPFVALKLFPKLPCLGIVDMNECIVAASNDFVFIKLKTGDYMTRMSCKGNVPRFDFATGPAMARHMVTAIE